MIKEADKEKILNSIISLNPSTVRELHEALPQYGEGELVALMHDNDFVIRIIDKRIEELTIRKHCLVSEANKLPR